MKLRDRLKKLETAAAEKPPRLPLLPGETPFFSLPLCMDRDTPAGRLTSEIKRLAILTHGGYGEPAPAEPNPQALDRMYFLIMLATAMYHAPPGVRPQAAALAVVFLDNFPGDAMPSIDQLPPTDGTDARSELDDWIELGRFMIVSEHGEAIEKAAAKTRHHHEVSY